MKSHIDNKKITKNTIALYIRMGISMIISFFTTRITLQVLGVEDYGLNNLVAGVVSMFSFINASMGTAVQRFYSIEIGKNNKERLSKVFGTGLYLHILVALITLLLAELFAVLFLNKLEIPENRMFAAHVIFQISVISLILNIISVPYTALLRAREEFTVIAFVQIIDSILKLGTLYLLLYIEFDKLILLSILNFAITCFHLGTLTYYSRRYKEAHSRVVKDKVLIKEMLSFISMLLITVLALLGRDQGIVVLINLFFGLTVNAAYAITMQVIQIANTFVTNFKQAIIPQLMASYGAGDLTSMYKLINFGTKITFVLMLLITFPLIFKGDYLLNIWLGEVPQYTTKLLILASIFINIDSFTYFHYQAVHATGNVVRQQTIISTLYILNIGIIFILFVLGLNFYSALWVNIIISIIKASINIYFCHKQTSYDISIFLKTVVLKCIGLVVIISIIGYIISTNTETNLPSFCIETLILLSSIMTLSIFIIFNKNERYKLLNLLKLKLKK